jgi:hypothetical protein
MYPYIPLAVPKIKNTIKYGLFLFPICFSSSHMYIKPKAMAAIMAKRGITSCSVIFIWFILIMVGLSS